MTFRHLWNILLCGSELHILLCRSKTDHQNERSHICLSYSTVGLPCLVQSTFYYLSDWPATPLTCAPWQIILFSFYMSYAHMHCCSSPIPGNCRIHSFWMEVVTMAFKRGLSLDKIPAIGHCHSLACKLTYTPTLRKLSFWFKLWSYIVISIIGVS